MLKGVSMNKNEILEQALYYLSTNGVKFTMSQLATSLQISKKTIYTMFDSKETLLLEVIENSFREIKRSEKQIIESDLKLEEKIKKLIIVLPDRYQNLNWYKVGELKEKYPKIYEVLIYHLQSDWKPTLDLLQQGIKEGVLKDFNVDVFKLIVEGTMEHILSNHQQIDYYQELEEMMNILMKGILK